LLNSLDHRCQFDKVSNELLPVCNLEEHISLCLLGKTSSPGQFTVRILKTTTEKSGKVYKMSPWMLWGLTLVTSGADICKYYDKI
jgi:hypothetical protein